MNKAFKRLATIAAILAFIVIVLGAWVRLSHAGLGCPDWPGCYGQLTWPNMAAEVQAANEAFPERPVEASKAWKEMIHRYLAGILVLLVVGMNWIAWRDRKTLAFRGKCVLLLSVILFQAALGMWTVTLKLLPIVVMGHLLGGMATLALLVWIIYGCRYAQGGQPGSPVKAMRPIIISLLCVLCIQIALGGWTSSNYAALACPDFPTCQGKMWPETDFPEGFVMLREVGVDFEGGVLDLPSRTAIHLTHRMGAVITLLLFVYAALRLIKIPSLQRNGVMLLSLVSLQFLLGILNVVMHLPLVNAVAHNGVAALLLSLLVGLLYRTSSGRIAAR
ncbi:MAG: cytochrome c oxidase assembly protein subunit 15 [Lysobacterales bacterium]|jgi:cytochrome c oxidase assembly protein subunit 15